MPSLSPGMAPSMGAYPSSLQEMYVSVLAVTGLAGISENAYALVAELEAKGASIAAGEVERLVVELFANLEGISVAMAARGTAIVREEEESSRVRPDTGLPGDQRMDTYLECDPISVLPGGVGVVNKHLIDNSKASWWWTNEIGYSGNEGRELHGYYYESGFTNRSAPGAAPSREHPLFKPTGDFGPPMTIMEPIPAREFVKRALDLLYTEWAQAVTMALSGFSLGVTQVMVGSPGAIIYAPIP